MTKITSLKQITANKLNAQKSTGPRTEKGKAWARRNAIKHGLRSVDVITVGENPSEFEQFNQQMLKELQPVDLFSMQLVNKIVITAWNLNDQIKFKAVSLPTRCNPIKRMNIKINYNRSIILILLKRMQQQ